MKKLNFIIHALELKYRFIYILINITYFFIVFFEYKIELFFLISKLFLSLERQFIYTNMLDPLLIYIKLIVINTSLFFLPLAFYLVTFYLMKSIYNVFIKIYCIFVLFLFVINFVLYYLLFNIGLKSLFLFLLSFQRSKENILLQFKIEATLEHYFSFFSFIILINVILFFIPLFFFIIINLPFLQNQLLKKFVFRKYLYFLILCIFFLIAPPELIIQICLLPFLFILIELYIYLLFFFHNLHIYFVRIT